MRSGSASVPNAGTTKYAESSKPLHHRGALAGAGRELLFRCIGHITPAVCSQLHSSPALTVSAEECAEAASTTVPETTAAI